MAAQAVTSTNALQASIVSDQRVIEFIYRAIKNAGRNAFDMEMGNKLPYYVVPVGSMTRMPNPRQVLTTYDRSPLTYISKDITIIGGAALNIYDSKLTGFKQRRVDEFKSLRNELDRETTDIDIVWWPRESNKNSGNIYTAESPAIFSFINSFIQSLYGTLHDLPKGLIPGLNNIEIEPRFMPMIGVHFIEIIFIINNKSYKIADLAIHDNGGSQQYNSSGNEIKRIVSMYDDPIYCSSLERNKFSTISFRDTKPYVPNILRYVTQQLFAYGNFRRKGDINKMNIIQKRIEYLIKILRSYLRSHTNQNKRNVNELFGVDTPYEKLVEDIVSLAEEKGITLKEKNKIKSSNLNTLNHVEEKEVISENNIKKMAEKSTKILEQQENNDRVQNIIAYSKRILSSTNTGEVNKYIHFLEELTNMDPNSVYAIIKKYINIMIVFSNLKKDLIKSNSAFMITGKYNDIYDHYAILGSHYIDELKKDPTNEKYKLELNKIAMKLENEIVSIQTNINRLQQSAGASTRRRRKGKARNPRTQKNKANN